MDIQTVILPPPRNRNQIAAYGRAINSCLARTPYMQISIRLPIYDPSIFHANSPTRSSFTFRPPRGKEPSPPSSFSAPSTPNRSPESRAAPLTKASEAELNATWEMWDAIRTICSYNPRLTLSACFDCGWRSGLCLTTLLLSSPGPHAAAAVSTGRLESLGCGTHQTLIHPGVVVYCKCEGVPGAPQGIPVVHSRRLEG
jgi:hypothetical protein